MFIFLTANTAFGQVLRLPTLVHHYLEHVEWDNSNLIEFLSEHYAKTINHPDDKHHDHENLPFKAVDYHSSQVVVFVPQTPFSLSQIIFETVNVKIAIHNQQDCSNSYLNSIWQPPRFS